METEGQASGGNKTTENAPKNRPEADGDVFHDAVDVEADADADSRGFSDRSEARDRLQDLDRIETGEREAVASLALGLTT